MYQIILLYNNVSNTIHYNNVSNIIVITSALKSTAVINLVGHSVAIKSSTVREVNKLYQNFLKNLQYVLYDGD